MAHTTASKESSDTTIAQGFGCFNQLASIVTAHTFNLDDKVEVVVQTAPKVAQQVMSKMDRSVEIYDEENIDGKQRKIIMGRFMVELNMSEKGANTYYYLAKKRSENGVVV